MYAIRSYYDFVVGHVGLGQQDVHVARHAPRHRVDGIDHLAAVFLQQPLQFLYRMLGLGDRHAVAGNDDHAFGRLEDKIGILGGNS